jgi:dTDP-4-amino-4,6-dideoxygalactose transaminase
MSEIPLFKVAMSENAIKATADVLSSGYIGQGSVNDKFEDELRQVFNNQYTLTTNSATSAEHLAMHMLKDHIGKRKTVLTTPLTCTATNWPIVLNDYDIKWVDVDPTTMNIDLYSLAANLDEHVGFVVVVHWGGYPVDMDRLDIILDQHKARYGYRPFVIEDCAHAYGSFYKGAPVGSRPNNFATFSFQAIKHLTAGDGGALVTPPEFYDRAKLLRWYGIDRTEKRSDFRCESDIKEVGFKFHMNDINAAIGMNNMNLAHLNIHQTKRNAAFYNRHLQDVDGVALLKHSDPDFESSYWIYTMLVEDQPSFVAMLKSKGIVTSRVHERNDIHRAMRRFENSYMLPQLNENIGNMICIPVGWWVTEEQRQYIVDSIKLGW